MFVLFWIFLKYKFREKSDREKMAPVPISIPTSATNNFFFKNG